MKNKTFLHVTKIKKSLSIEHDALQPSEHEMSENDTSVLAVLAEAFVWVALFSFDRPPAGFNEDR